MALPTSHLKPLIHFVRAHQGSTQYQVSLPRVKQWRWETDHSPPPRTETKNEWTNISVCREWRETVLPLPVWMETLPKGKFWWPFLAHSWLKKTHQHIFCTASPFLNIYGSLLFPETCLPSKVSYIKTWLLHWYGQNKVCGWPLYQGIVTTSN